MQQHLEELGLGDGGERGTEHGPRVSLTSGLGSTSTPGTLRRSHGPWPGAMAPGPRSRTLATLKKMFGAAGGTLACLLTAALGHQLGTAVKALALLYQTDFALAGLSFGQNLVVILLGAGIGWLAAFFSVSRKIATFSY